MASQYQQDSEALKRDACNQCSGFGTCSDAEAGDTYYNEWRCPRCKGTGYEPKQSQGKTGDGK